jgi:hypothetical protein
MRRIGGLRRAVAAGLLAWNAVGCYTWKSPHITPQEVLSGPPRDRILVETDFSRFQVRAPVLARDTIWGTYTERRQERDQRVRYQPTPVTGIPLADVRRVKVRGVNAALTSVAVLAGLVVVAGAGAALMLSTYRSSIGSGYYGGTGDSYCPGGWGGC